MQILNCNNDIYKKQLVDLYIEVFSSGLSEQYIDEVALDLYINNLFANSSSFIAIKNKELAGAILCTELKNDPLLPSNLQQQYNLNKSVYIAELMVSKKFQGQGIGSMLLNTVVSNAQKSGITDAFIRVWKENGGAIKLYKKMGFEPVASIEQTKLKADGMETFVMEKIYLHKKID